MPETDDKSLMPARQPCVRKNTGPPRKLRSLNARGLKKITAAAAAAAFDRGSAGGEESSPVLGHSKDCGHGLLAGSKTDNNSEGETFSWKKACSSVKFCNTEQEQ